MNYKKILCPLIASLNICPKTPRYTREEIEELLERMRFQLRLHLASASTPPPPLSQITTCCCCEGEAKANCANVSCTNAILRREWQNNRGGFEPHMERPITGPVTFQKGFNLEKVDSTCRKA